MTGLRPGEKIYEELLIDCDAAIKTGHPKIFCAREAKLAWQVIPIIAVTDLAFSLDSVATAIAVSTDTWLVITGATIGIILLRFMADLFIRWLGEYTHLEDAGYVAVGLVGVKLLVRALYPDLEIPEQITIAMVAIIFTWGFSQRKESAQE